MNFVVGTPFQPGKSYCGNVLTIDCAELYCATIIITATPCAVPFVVEYVVYEEKNIAAIKESQLMLDRYPAYDVFAEYAKKVDKLEKEIRKNRKFRWMKKRRFY